MGNPEPSQAITSRDYFLFFGNISYFFAMYKLNHFSCNLILLFLDVFPTETWRTDFSIPLFPVCSNILHI